MQDCIFCKIANGEIPSATIYEDEDFRGILDLGPASRGHGLLLPKKHFADIFALDDQTASRALVAAKHLAASMKKALNCEGLNILQNNGQLAGQSVFHFHIHLIPRYQGDAVGLPAWKPGEAAKEELEEIAQAIRNA